MKLILGDCLASLKELPADSVDSVVTDPPYELGFMGKSWDSTGIAFQPELWAEVLRVLKPGGHLLSFSGSRTYHRIAVAIEDAGFEIRDQIMWIYGSGFPKSLNVAKAIDKMEGVEPTVVGQRLAQGSARKIKGTNAAANKIPNSGSLEFDETIILQTKATSEAAKRWEGWGTGLKPAHEPIVLARKPLIGTVAHNVLTYGTGAINIDGSRVGSGTGEAKTVNYPDIRGNNYNNASGSVEYVVTDQGRFPANVIHDGSDKVVELFPDTGKSTGGQKSLGAFRGGKVYGTGKDIREAGDPGFGDSGSAARFFYCAKASKHDRNEGLDGFPEIKGGSMNGAETREGKPTNHPVRANHHPTVKPTDLMRYLCRLITPPNGTILDPFMGSGSTGKAAVLEGFDFIGMEQSQDYLQIAQARIAHAESNKGLW